MSETDEIEFEQPLEEDVDQITVAPTKRKLYTEQGDPEIESLFGKHKRGKLLIQPDFQRQFVWDGAKASRLIESVLLEIPLPVIYISQEKGGQEHVIDGQQRLTSFFSFIDGFFQTRGNFAYRGSRYLRNLMESGLLSLTTSSKTRSGTTKLEPSRLSKNQRSI